MNVINKKIIISIEGNICSGKSTLVKILSEKYNKNILFVDEPVSDWKEMKMDNKNIIEHFYLNKKKFGYLFQSTAFITRVKRLTEALQNDKYKIIITERSMESDKYLFAKMLYEQHILNELEWNVYNKWFDFFNIKINYFIYIRTDINNCIKRIINRNRDGENKISKKYIEELHNKHDDWLLTKDNSIVINGNVNIFDEHIRKKQCEVIYEYLSKIIYQ